MRIYQCWKTSPCVGTWPTQGFTVVDEGSQHLFSCASPSLKSRFHKEHLVLVIAPLGMFACLYRCLLGFVNSPVSLVLAL